MQSKNHLESEATGNQNMQKASSEVIVPGPTVHIATPNAILRFCQNAGASTQELFAFANIQSMETFLKQGRLPLKQVLKLWEYAEKLGGQTFRPQDIARLVQTGDFRIMDYLLMSCDSLISGFPILFKCWNYICEAFTFTQENHKGNLILEIVPAVGVELPPSLVEYIFATFLLRCQKYSGVEVVAARAEIRGSHRGMRIVTNLCGCPIYYKQERNRLIFNSDLLRQPLPNVDPALRDVLTNHLVETFSGSYGDLFMPSFEKALETSFGSFDIRVGSVARQLRMTVRTLERRLRERGTSFRINVEQHRKQMLERLVESLPYNANEYANYLGYSDSRAFYRAFKRWHGCSPREYFVRVGSKGTSGFRDLE